MNFLNTPLLASALAMAALCPIAVYAAPKDMQHNSPGAFNPMIPGYFADPTLKKFGDTYYVYATTDGSGAGFGPAQLWQSKDLVNWTLMPMNWPDSHWIWAPDVIHNTNDNMYYYVYCQPCQIHVGVSETPRGPWQNILGESEAVLVPDRFVTNAITLDGQTFVDDDGSIYMYWGTWGIYDGFGCGAGKLTPDMKGFTETRLIPNTEVTDFFEAPFVLKKDGKYYFMYSSDSCHDHTYRVQYATADNPLGPYTYQGCILETNDDGTVHGPGHHSVMQDGDDYYIVYHRHDNPHSNRGFHRQICVDKMEFTKDGRILPIKPTHDGIGYLGTPTVSKNNLAFGKKVTASSNYDDNFRPEYAVDDNNGTLWRPAGMGQEWIEIDLGKNENIRTILTQWEYGTQFYQYLIETSLDGKNWEIFSDKRSNRLAGSPMVDFGDKQARYVRITSTGGEKAGFNGALWNVKVFDTLETKLPQQWIGLTGSDWNGREWVNNQGQLGGKFSLAKGFASSKRIDGREALVLTPGTELVMETAVIDPALPHTASALTYKDGKWMPVSLDGSLNKGKVTISAPAGEPLVLADVRLYNWQLTDAEKKFDATNPIRRNPVADRESKGRLVDINASSFNAGDTVGYIPNLGCIDGYFEAISVPAADGSISSPAIVEEIKGKKAFRFDGNNFYRSNFPLPTTVRDNAPYTLEAVILNPQMDLNECYADFTTTHDEMEKIMGVNGTEPRCGIMNHYGWYEDAGWNDAYLRQSLSNPNANIRAHKDIKAKKGKYSSRGPEAAGNKPRELPRHFDPSDVDLSVIGAEAAFNTGEIERPQQQTTDNIAKQYEGEWQHIYVCFDGRIEKVYINGKLVSEKDIQLLVKPVQYVTLGRNAEEEWPFTGYIHSLRLSDEYIPFE